MSTSGSIDFTVSRDDIIEEALKIHLGVLGEGQAPSASQLSDLSRTLNMLVKSLQVRNIDIWAVDHVTLFLEEDKIEYTTGTDHIAKTSGVTRTTLASSAASSASTISVTSATGIVTTYNIGIELDSGTMQWTTVNGAPSGTTVTLTATLTGAATAGNNVYVYISKISPLYIKSIIEPLRRTYALQDIPISLISRNEYVYLSNKRTEGPVNQIYFQPNLASGVITTYPETSDATDTLELYVKRTLEDFDAASNNPDFPSEWYQPLAIGLAALAANGYGKTIPERQYLSMLAEKTLQDAEGWDREQGTSVFLRPDTMGRY